MLVFVMFFSIQLHVWLTLFTKLCFARDVKQYECGAHGKFEYCIDGIPGCIVGCHCHPGYYFDTDSKICEPNTKLLHVRRQYDGGPYPIHEVINTPLSNLYPTATPAVTNAIEQKVEDIANNAEDIGDWLFNQFSKTIESQIINNTNHNEKPPTRRSGGNASKTIKKKRSKVSKRPKKKGKQKGKEHGLRRKLLRITEDDSLFESHSGSDGSEDSSSSSESDSSDNSGDSEERKTRKKHGHRKLLVFNKKGKPPLPSFIFLPSMNTGYYPPIGLPPPPMQAMPMYPVAPLPPMAPIFPFSVSPSSDKTCASDTTTTEKSITTSTTTDSTTTQSSSTDTTTTQSSSTDTTTTQSSSTDTTTTQSSSTDTTTTTTTSTSTSTTTKASARMRTKKRQGLGPPYFDSGPALRSTNKQRRNKIMQKLRDQMIGNYQSPDDNMQHETPGDTIYDETLMNGPTSQESFPYSQKVAPVGNEIPKLKNTDFTYLSDLIHKANLNNTPPHRTYNKHRIINSNKISDLSQISRRNLDYNNHPYAELINKFNGPPIIAAVPGSTDYYANLGRQIASLVRGVNFNGDQQINIEVEQMKFEPTMHPIMNINRLAPQSYWERSVRSPLIYTKDQKVSENISNEKLFSLEKEVETFANTKPPMSLQDLENVLNTINNAQFHLHKNVYPDMHNTSCNSLNINLLPHSETEYDLEYNKPKYSSVVSLRRKVSLPVAIHSASNKTSRRDEPRIDTSVDGLWPIDDMSYKNTQNKYLKGNYNQKPTRKPLRIETVPAGMIPRDVEYLNFIKVGPRIQATTQLPYVNYHSQIMTYPLNLENQYEHRGKVSSNHSPLTRKFIEKRPGPSYFHHALHHFDYFD